MLMEKERREIVEYGKQMLSSGLTKGTAGNISIYDAETGYVAISPSGIGYFDTEEEDIVIIDLNGNVIEGKRTPSSEHGLHTAIYRIKPQMRAVVHTHSTFCTTLACLNQPLKAVHYVLADAGTSCVPLVPYWTYGTPELAEAVEHTIGESNAVLLANHGMLACGETLKAAFGLATTCEWVAEIQWRCQCAGTPSILSEEQIHVVMDHFRTYGQTDGEGNTQAHGYNG